MKLCAHLFKSFGEKCIFSDLSLDVSGRIVAIVGPSGCGKTTLFRLMLGLERPDNGWVNVFLPAGVVFSDLRLVEWMSVRENIRLVSPAVSEDKLSGVLGFFELSQLSGAVAHLSSGERQRAALVRAWLFDSPWMLLDEAFRSWDIGLKQRLLPFLRDFWLREKEMVFLITHDIGEALMVADTVVMFSFPPVQILDIQEVALSPEERKTMSPNHPLFMHIRQKLSGYFDPIVVMNHLER